MELKHGLKAYRNFWTKAHPSVWATVELSRLRLTVSYPDKRHWGPGHGSLIALPSVAA